MIAFPYLNLKKTEKCLSTVFLLIAVSECVFAQTFQCSLQSEGFCHLQNNQ